MGLQAPGDIVGAEDRHLGRSLQPVALHHEHVGPGNRQDRCRPPRRRGHGADGLAAPGRRVDGIDQGVIGQERRQVLQHPDRPDPRAAAAVGNGEGLVQVQVRHVGADFAGPADADQGIQVGAVEIHLAAVAVNDGADLADRLLEDPVRRRIGDHQRRQPVMVFLGLGLEVADIDVAGLVAGNHHHPQPGHLGAGRVGAVGRGRDQADVAAALALALQVFADDQKARVFAL